MKTLAKFMSRKKDKSNEEAGCSNAINNSYDITSREYIMPLIKFVNEKYSK